MPRFGFGFGAGRRRSVASGPPVPRIVLSASSIAEDATVGTTIGTLSVNNGSGTYTFTETADPDSKFTLDGTALKVGAALNYETATSHSVTIEADNGVDDPISRAFTISVTNVLDAPSLSALTLSASEAEQNESTTINIVGATSGSTITADQVPAGMTLNSGARTISGTPTTLGSTAIALTETLADSPNSPRVSNVSIEVVEAPVEPARAVFLAIGDSLLPGRGNADADRTGADPEVTNSMQWVNWSGQGNYQELDTNASPLWFPDDGVARISMMERVLIDYNAAAGEATAVIPVAVGGSSLATGWNFNTPGTNLANALTAYDAAMAELLALNAASYVAGVVIDLTSNDTYNYATLKPLWLGLIDYIRANFDGIDDTTPFFLGGPASGGGSTPDNKRALVEEIALERINCFVVHPPYPTADGSNLHPIPSENRTWGANIATLADAVLNGAGQTIPTITTSPTQGNLLGEALAINLHHTGLDAASKYGLLEITGGANEAEFEIAGTWAAPVLRWTGDGTGPASEGVYEVEISARNNAWEYGAPVTIAVEVAEPDVIPVNVVHTYSNLDLDTSEGSFSVASVPVKAGLNLFYWFAGVGANKDATFVMRVNGTPITKIAGVATSSNQQLWAYESAIDTTVTLSATWTANTFTDTRLLACVVEGVDPTATATASIAWANTLITQPYATSSITCPTGGVVVGLGMFGGNTTFNAVSPCERTYYNLFAGITYGFIIERPDTGALQWNSTNGNQYRAIIAAAFGPAA